MTTCDNIMVTLIGNDSTAIMITDSTGIYSFTNVSGGNYVLIPTKLNYSFTPVNLELDVHSDIINIDFVAVENTYAVSGTIAGDISEGVLITLSGDILDSTAVTQVDGSYSFLNVPPGNYVITPLLDGYLFDPVNLEITITDNEVTSNDFTSAVNEIYFTITFFDDYTEEDKTYTSSGGGRIDIESGWGDGIPAALLNFKCFDMPLDSTTVWSVGVDGNNGIGVGEEYTCITPNPMYGMNVEGEYYDNRCPMKMTVIKDEVIICEYENILRWIGY